MRASRRCCLPRRRVYFKTMPKAPLTPEDAQWLVESRKRNQSSSAKLYRLLREYPELTAKTKGEIRYDAQTLVAVAFSLWRALFLSGRSASGTETAQHAELFLAEILENNAINFTQDRNSQNWTFNYYMANARASTEIGAPARNRLPRPVANSRLRRVRPDGSRNRRANAIQ